MQSLDNFAEAKLAQLKRDTLLRTLNDDERIDAVHVERAGRRLVSFACNDYLNLSHDPRVRTAASEAALRYGAGAGASRLVTGNHPLLRELEAALAQFKGVADACVFGAGYLANVGITPCLVGPQDVVFVDALAHACLWAGAHLSKAKVHTFAHNDMGRLGALLAAHRADHRHALVLTDGVFSMDGDLAPVGGLTEICAAHDAWLLVDDAHGLGVLGDGRGASHAFGSARPPLQMGTLSKAAGSFGGYLCASAPVIDLVRNRARSFVYSTGLPPASAAAALAALRIIQHDPDLVAKPLRKARRFTRALGLAEAQSPIVAVVLGEPARALEASAALQREGYLVAPIRPPTVPSGTARLRFAFTAAHDDGDIDRLAALTAEFLVRQ